MTGQPADCRCDGNPSGGACSYPDCQLPPPTTEELFGAAPASEPVSAPDVLVERLAKCLRESYERGRWRPREAVFYDCLDALAALASARGETSR